MDSQEKVVVKLDEYSKNVIEERLQSALDFAKSREVASIVEILESALEELGKIEVDPSAEATTVTPAGEMVENASAAPEEGLTAPGVPSQEEKGEAPVVPEEQVETDEPTNPDNL